MERPLSAEDIPYSSLLRVQLGDDKLDRLLAYFEPVQAKAGEVLVNQGEGHGPTFIVVSGSVQVSRAGNPLIKLEPGDIVGGLAKRQPGGQLDASVVAVDEARLGKLTPDQWQCVCEEAPEVALKALRVLIGEGEMFTDAPTMMLRTVGTRQKEITVHVGGATLHVNMDTPANRILPERVDDHLVVAALLDRKAVSLTTKISTPCHVEPLTTATLDGQRFYRRSQALLLLEAAHQFDPTLQPRLSHSIGFAQRVEIEANGVDVSIIAAAIDEKMQELVANDVPLVEEFISVTEARDLFQNRGWHDAAHQLSVSRSGLVKMVAYGELFVASPGPLLPSTGLIGRSKLVYDGDVMLLIYGKEGRHAVSSEPEQFERTDTETGRVAVSTYRQTDTTVQRQHRWLNAVGIGSVGEFNNACITGDVSQIIRVSEGFQEKRIGRIADEIAARRGQVKVVAVAGPSSSGKSTFIRRLKVQLQVNGITPFELGLDDYYCNRDETPLDEDGEYDYESIFALQLALLEDHLSRITAGECVQTPRYDFVNGKSVLDGGHVIQLGDSDVLLLEGIHGLNPVMVDSLEPDAAYRIFVCPLTQLPFDALSRVHVSDVRLLRRIVRDRHGRSAPAADTIMRWPSVRAGERVNIFVSTAC